VPDGERDGPATERSDGARLCRLSALGFRNLASQELELADGITLLWGANGAGKTNLLEAVCVVLSGRSCRTRNERELIGFAERLCRVEAVVGEGAGAHQLLWSLSRGGERRHLVDTKPATPEGAHLRPALAIFLPDRLALIKGPPGGRREHLDRLVTALWPSRAEARRRYGRALAQRNALLGRVRAGRASADSLDAWDGELAAAGVELARARRDAVATLASEFAAAAEELGLPGVAELDYRARSQTSEPHQLAAELRDRRELDLGRGHTTHGPHLDDLAISLAGRSVRRFGSQGEQRTALLALLFAERRALLEARRAPPLMLLDDVMSELDPDRRSLLAGRLAEGGGQAILTATEPGQLPVACARMELVIRRGRALSRASAPDGAPAEMPTPAVAA
jgi:DNA replication and repair protein RecF